MCIAEFAEVRAAVVGRQEIQETFVIARRDVEQLQQGSIVAAARAQTSPDQLPDIVSGDIAAQEQRVNVLPERVPPSTSAR